MARPRKPISPRKLHVALPQDLANRLEIYLTSTAQGRVPLGAWSDFFAERTREFFAKLERSTNVPGNAVES